ncbi:hypothetical protein B4U80_15056 [Leptotrombidium deliense]|uniref:BTB domain-containing protein n=1 Tax=Leptotrombidium deliense TaxID=299467 RepID=A0A443RS22_9ACAR|nr:hypothetical protein B4U80_15056 [Leptotrombidium deliense]
MIRNLKIILSRCSSVFTTMFSSDFVESKEHVVTIRDVDAECFYVFLKYIYTDELSGINKVKFCRGANPNEPELEQPFMRRGNKHESGETETVTFFFRVNFHVFLC